MTTTGPRIIILDDDAHGRALARAELRREFPAAGFVDAADAAELRRLLEERAPDAVVTEGHVAWGDYRSVLRMVKARYPACPVVLFTAAADLDAVVAAMRAGLDDCVLKPLEGAGRLGGAVQDALARAAERRMAREAESAYRRFFEGATIGMYRTTRDGVFVDANQALADMLGYDHPRELFSIRAVDLYVDPEERRRWRAALDEKGVVRRYPVTLRRRDGSEVRVAITARGGRGVPLFEGVVEDLTAREQADAALRASEARYRALIEQVPAATYVATPDNARTTYVSPQIERMLGWPAEHWRAGSDRWIEGLHPADREATLRAFREADPVGPLCVEYRMIARDGSTVWIRDESSLLLDDMGCPLFRQGVMCDVSETYRAQEAVRERDERLRHLVEQLPLVAWTTDAGLCFTSLSGAGLSSLGLRPEQLVGRSLADFLGDDEQAPALIALAERALDGEPVRFAHDYRGQSLQVDVQPFRDAAGEIAGTLGIALNVTPTRLAEDTRDRLIAILEATPDFVAICDLDGGLVYLNGSGRRLFGLPADAFLAGRALAELDPECHLLPPAGAAAALRDGTWCGEGELRAGDGRRVPVSLVLVGHRNGHDAVEFLSIIARDISAHRRAEEEIRRHSDFSARLIDSSVDGIVAFDRDARFTIWNGTMTRVTGIAPAEALGRTAADVLPFLKETGEERFFAEALAGRTIVAKDRAYVLPNGRRGFFEGHYTPLLGEGGAVLGGLAIIRDVTERRSLEEQLRQSQKMEAVGRLAGGVAHDFNNLLTVITGYTELMLLGESDAGRAGFAREILGAADKAAAMTQQLLAFSRRQVLQPRVLRLDGVLSEMDKLLRRLIGEDVELHVDCSEEIGHVRADPSQLEQVVMNLAVNARDAMPRGGRLAVRTTAVEVVGDEKHRLLEAPPGRYVVLSVSDTGVGMDADTRERIFEPFFTTKKKGTGLGLATVYGIVRQSGGTIDVESEPGCGSTFHVYLPEVEPDAARGPELRPARPRGGEETVLVLEDEDGVRDLSRLVLASYGYRVIDARTPEDAIRICEDHGGPIHALLADVVLPGMSGPAVAERLARSHPDLKVIYMSGYTDEAIRTHGLAQTTSAFVKKPFTPEMLARKVREVLDTV